MGKVERGDAWDRALMATYEFENLFGELIAKYTREPADNLISRLVLASQASEHELSPDQLVGACSLLLFGGHETTMSLLSNAILALMQRPADRAKLRSDPELIESAVEEFLRFDGPSKIVVRRAREDALWHGIPLRTGDVVYCAIGAANRDPIVFEQADELAIDRKPNRHVSFGWGLHHCLGAQLARLEAIVAIPMILEAFPNMTLAGELRDLRYHPTVVGRTLKALPVVLG
jgi:cytochrome P450